MNPNFKTIEDIVIVYAYYFEVVHLGSYVSKVIKLEKCCESLRS
jgi:hypothetical protein